MTSDQIRILLDQLESTIHELWKSARGTGYEPQLKVAADIISQCYVWHCSKSVTWDVIVPMLESIHRILYGIAAAEGFRGMDRYCRAAHRLSLMIDRRTA